jgi:hypothetical protein
MILDYNPPEPLCKWKYTKKVAESPILSQRFFEASMKPGEIIKNALAKYYRPGITCPP